MTEEERAIELTLIAEGVPEHDHDSLINYILRGAPDRRLPPSRVGEQPHRVLRTSRHEEPRGAL
jgi:hypothetical protein